ncbi:hypothetical protein NQ318_001175 [Aromia moschata]|uniref:HTH CENPB-type domain-containing protein n=1 Tax=Aromia moschata TaxID=1265417 RepID=A0AAV8ZGD5_9CUCU|nr:hypothetical protein NQ318_001175 [Aromia moschata]
MSRRGRKTDRRTYPSSLIEEDRKRIVDGGESKRSVASALGIPESTLRKYLKTDAPATKLGRYDSTFTKEMEDEFYEYIKKVDNMYYGITARRLRVLAYEFAEKNGIPHRFNKDTRMAGKEWLRAFLKRHSDLSIRQPTSTSIVRAIGFNKPQCDRFFENLANLMKTHNFPPHAVYNMDETGISTVLNKLPRVISTKGKRCVNKISSAERGTNITAVCAMNASAHFIPPEADTSSHPHSYLQENV